MGFLLLIPFFLIRFGLLYLLDRKALERAARFAPMAGRERIAYYLYQLSNAAILIYMFFLRIQPSPSPFFWAGIIVYLLGNVLLIASVINFARPSKSGLHKRGLYALSRNPMYLAYFLYFIGCVFLTRSFVLFGMVLLFQISAHRIILAEERWCLESFGTEYQQYMREVRRYI